MSTQQKIREIIEAQEIYTQSELQQVLKAKYDQEITVSGICVALKKLNAVKTATGYQVSRGNVVEIKRLGETPLPKKAHIADAGFDLEASHDSMLFEGAATVVSTGIAISLPVGYEAQIRGRSGNAAKLGIFVVNAPGTIDSGYTGEIKVILSCLKDSVKIQKGMRIAQMVIQKLPDIEFREVNQFEETDRGNSGFGSSGG